MRFAQFTARQTLEAVNHMKLWNQSAKMILRFTFAWAVAVVGQSTSDNHFIGWYLQPETSTYTEIFNRNV